jgi:hypothetical protein
MSSIYRIKYKEPPISFIQRIKSWFFQCLEQEPYPLNIKMNHRNREAIIASTLGIYHEEYLENKLYYNKLYKKMLKEYEGEL